MRVSVRLNNMSHGGEGGVEKVDVNGAVDQGAWTCGVEGWSKELRWSRVTILVFSFATISHLLLGLILHDFFATLRLLQNDLCIGKINVVFIRTRT